MEENANPNVDPQEVFDWVHEGLRRKFLEAVRDDEKYAYLTMRHFAKLYASSSAYWKIDEMPEDQLLSLVARIASKNQQTLEIILNTARQLYAELPKNAHFQPEC